MKLAILDPSFNENEHLDLMLRHYLNANRESADIEVYDDFDSFEKEYSPGEHFFLFIDAEKYPHIPTEDLLFCLDKSEELVVVFFHDKGYEKPAHERFRFLERPVSAEAFTEMLDSELANYYTDSRQVSFEVGKNKYEILMGDILYVNIEDHQTVIHVVTGERIPLRMTFGRFLDLVNYDPRFMICNRNLVINMDRISEIDEFQVTLEDGTVIPLRRNIQKRSLNQWMQYEERKESLSAAKEIYR